MQTLEDVIEIRQIIVGAVSAEERVKRFTPRRRILRDPQPKLLSFGREVPFRCESRQVNLAVWPIGCSSLRGMPERRKLSVGCGLARLLRAVGLISKSKI